MVHVIEKTVSYIIQCAHFTSGDTEVQGLAVRSPGSERLSGNLELVCRPSPPCVSITTGPHVFPLAILFCALLLESLLAIFSKEMIEFEYSVVFGLCGFFFFFLRLHAFNCPCKYRDTFLGGLLLKCKWVFFFFF